MEAATRPLEPLTPDPPSDPLLSDALAQTSEATARDRAGAGHTSHATGGSAASQAAPLRHVPPLSPTSPTMDRDFIVRNQIVERYLSGKLPIKGAMEFERFCREHPELLDEIGLAERVNAGLRLLEASGKPEPWEETPKKFWEKPPFVVGLGTAAVVFVAATAVFASSSSERAARIAALEQQIIEQPLEPATTTREIRLLPSRKGSSNSPAVIIGGGAAQLADMRIDMSKSSYRNFRVTIDRIDQGRVAILHNLTKDSNGHLRIALNSSALGPGNYQFTIEGLTWRGEPEPDAWLTIGIQR